MRKIFLFLIISFIFNINPILGQEDVDSAFFDYKLRASILHTVSKKDNTVEKFLLKNTYFFFTRKVIFRCDEFGVSLYRLGINYNYEELEENFIKFKNHTITAIEIKYNFKCRIILKEYGDNTFKLIIMYDNYDYVFDLVSID